MVTMSRWAMRAVLLAGAAAGCTVVPAPKVISVPPEMVRPRPPPAAAGTAAAAAARMEVRQATEASKYVMRLAEGGRVWEVELPESAGGYEMRVPLAGGPLEQMTQADEELLADTTVKNATGPLLDTVPAKAVDAKRASQKRSYLGSMAKVNEMYTQKRYELALIEVVSLEKEYPQDARIQAMKGSLYLKLGRHKLARESWEKALSISPNDQGIAEALRELSNRSEE